jgi:hypothetical protein
MTHPDETDTSDDTTQGAGEAGALAAASRDHEGTGDPLGPLNRVTEDDES